MCVFKQKSTSSKIGYTKKKREKKFDKDPSSENVNLRKKNELYNLMIIRLN